MPFDLSKVLFIATANVLDTIPAPLRDRMEIIELSGYTEDEKLAIATRYLLQRQLAANGLKPEQVELSEEALRLIARNYTREAGVRNFERQIGSVLRHAAVTIAAGEATHVAIGADDLARILGAARFESEVAMRTNLPGVATGLAWTPAGGDILFVESSRVRGNGKLTLTGQLGDVMKESAQAAVTLVKSQAELLGIDPLVFDNGDLHIHVPAGAIPKDGPSAGVAIVDLARLAAIASQRAPGRGDDRRDQPARAGAAGRRHQGEMRRGRPRRHPHRDPAGAQPPRLRRHPGERAQAARVRLGRADRGRAGAGTGERTRAARGGLRLQPRDGARLHYQ